MGAKRRFLSILISLAMALGLVSGMSLTAWAAEDEPTEAEVVAEVGEALEVEVPADVEDAIETEAFVQEEDPSEAESPAQEEDPAESEFLPAADDQLMAQEMSLTTNAGDTVEYVASVGEKKYESFEKAFVAAVEGQTITLLADVEVAGDAYFPIYNLTIDLNGYGIYKTNTTGQSVFTAVNQGKPIHLTIKDSNPGNTSDTSGHRPAGVAGGYITGVNQIGVLAAPGGTITMEGGTITVNSSDSLAGVYVSYGSFIMNGGAISNCESRYGGVMCVPGSSFTMNGGTIANNTAGGAGGGIYSRGTLTFGSSGNSAIAIQGNKSGDTNRNVYLGKSGDVQTKLAIGGELAVTGPIGITMAEPGVFTSGWNAAMDGKTPRDYFASDDSAYAVWPEGDELKLDYPEAVPATVTANDRTYDGTEKPLATVTGEAVGGTMAYALGTDAEAVPTEGWGASIPTATDAGAYYVWYKAVGDEAHSDSEPASVVVTIAPAPEPAPEPEAAYDCVEGDGAAWTKGSSDPLEFVFKRSAGDGTTYSRFEAVSVDGKELAKGTDYTVAKGSVVLTLLPGFLATLSDGEHTLTATFDDGSAEAAFTVEKAAASDEQQDADPSASPDEATSTTSGKTTSTTSKTTTSSSTTKAALPLTGDSPMIPLLFAVALAAAALAVVAAQSRSRASKRGRHAR